MRQQVRAIRKLTQAVMRDGEHYGRLPGSRKPSLWKAGAEKLCVAFHIEASFVIDDLSTREQFRYRAKCIGTHQLTRIKLGEGLGACSSMEQKYRWRRAADEEFDRTPEDRRRFKYGYNQEERRWYEVKQVRAEHEDIENTILKMACKRAHVAMTLNVTAASDIFSQDIEDLPEHLREAADGPQRKRVKQPQRKSRKSRGKGTRALTGRMIQADPVDASLSLSEGQQRILRSRMEEAKLSDQELIQKFGSALRDIPAGKFNEVASWVREASASRT
jgi:hypothetical protein